MIAAFRRWAFAPVDTAPMAALRIACGLLVLGWTLAYLPDAQTFLADDGTQPAHERGTDGWWVVDLVSPYATLALLALAAIALTVGWHTRLASVMVAVVLVAVQRRNPFVLNSGDLLLREMAILIALMPAGERWSLDARGKTPEPRAPWALRLLQLQVSAVYLFSVVAKLHGDSWPNGSAVGMSLQLEDMQRIALPEAFATSVTVSALMTYGTLVLEGLLIFALWLPRARWVAIPSGIALHLGIDATMLIGWFSFTIIACYLAFVPAPQLERAAKLWPWTRGSGAGSRRRTPGACPSPAPASGAPGS